MTVEEENSETTGMNRRSFIGKAGVGVAGFAAAGALLAACGDDDDTEPAAAEGETAPTAEAAATAAPEEIELSQDLPEIEWEMATSWPTALVTIFGAAQIFAEQVSRLTGGKFKINPRPAGEIVGGLEVLPTVRDGGVEVGHTASYYYVGLSPVQQFGTAVPFGLTQRQQNAWLYQG
ncbi:MAG: ABC transporter substrate-binding protein, partial [Acidimicrobiales bacterium]